MTKAHDLLRSYLRQRRELGETELVLDQHTAAEFEALLRPGGMPPPAPAAAPRREAAAPPQRAAAPPRRETLAPAVVASPVAAPGEADTHRRAGAPVPGTVPHPPAPDAPARYAEAGEIASLPTLQAVCEVALGCPRCRLAQTRTRVVFGEGREDADVLVVGEAPGQDEDASGRPFVGRAGKLLDLLLLSAGFPREDVYVCNVLKCRPPRNRNPEPDEVSACSPYLLRQVELVRPRVIVAFGNFAAQTLLGTDTGIGRLRGRVHEYRGIPLVPTYHPSAALRNQGWVRAVWDDLQAVRRVLAA